MNMYILGNSISQVILHKISLSWIVHYEEEMFCYRVHFPGQEVSNLLFIILG